MTSHFKSRVLSFHVYAYYGNIRVDEGATCRGRSRYKDLMQSEVLLNERKRKEFDG